MPVLKVERVRGPARREIIKGLHAHNVSVLGGYEFQPLTVTIRQKGKIVGGLAAEMFLGWMFVEAIFGPP